MLPQDAPAGRHPASPPHIEVKARDAPAGRSELCVSCFNFACTAVIKFAQVPCESISPNSPRAHCRCLPFSHVLGLRAGEEAGAEGAPSDHLRETLARPPKERHCQGIPYLGLHLGDLDKSPQNKGGLCQGILSLPRLGLPLFAKR